MNLPAISLFEVPSLHTARFFSAGLEGRSKKFRPEAFACILAATLEFFGGRSDDRFEGWFGPGVKLIKYIYIYIYIGYSKESNDQLPTVESLRRETSCCCCCSQPVSCMLATVLNCLTDFLSGAIMESRKAARSKAFAGSLDFTASAHWAPFHFY